MIDIGTFGYSASDVKLIDYIVGYGIEHKTCRKIFKFMHRINLTCKNLRLDWKPKFRTEFVNTSYDEFCKSILRHEYEKLLTKKWNNTIKNLVDDCIKQRYDDLNTDWHLYV